MLLSLPEDVGKVVAQACPFVVGPDLALLPLAMCLELSVCLGGLGQSTLVADMAHTAFVSAAGVADGYDARRQHAHVVGRAQRLPHAATPEADPRCDMLGLF